jgi:hypothetical protein|tara:strand:+ start:70 stop:378 length:309 start_codon:yes stop_codon:yes gene_type:complete
MAMPSRNGTFFKNQKTKENKMAFNHDTKSETYFTISPRQINPNGKNYTNPEKKLMHEQLRNEGLGNRRFKSREDGIEALSKTALNSDLFEVCQTSSLGYFTL